MDVWILKAVNADTALNSIPDH